jgi:hypothetical protein
VPVFLGPPLQAVAQAHIITQAQQERQVCGVGCSFAQINFTAPIPPGKRLVHLTNDEDAMNQDYRCDVPWRWRSIRIAVRPTGSR